MTAALRDAEAVALPAPERVGPGYFDTAAALAALAEGRPVAFPPFELVHWGGLTFALNYRRDPIQSALRRGRFYEAEELAELGRRLPPGAHVIDIGANIGNHAVWFATRMNAARVVVIEPNPLATAPLLANVVMNGLREVICTDLLGVGLADRSDSGFAIRRHDRNLGASKMRKREDGAGRFSVHAGDDLLAGERADLVKIDVEGMELQVLKGLGATIARCRPLMLVEVMEENLPGFEAWRDAAGYVTARTWKVGPKNANHLIEPAEGRRAADSAPAAEN